MSQVRSEAAFEHARQLCGRVRDCQDTMEVDFTQLRDLVHLCNDYGRRQGSRPDFSGALRIRVRNMPELDAVGVIAEKSYKLRANVVCQREAIRSFEDLQRQYFSTKLHKNPEESVQCSKHIQYGIDRELELLSSDPAVLRR